MHSFEPGGVERIALRLAERWQASGHEVTIVLGRDRGPSRAQAPALNYITRPEPVSTARWETPWLIWCLWRYLRPGRPDVLFCPGNTYTIVCVAMALLLGRRCPPVLVKISNDLDRDDANPVFRAAYHFWLRVQARLLRNFVAMGPGAEEEIARRLPRRDGLTVVIFNPVIDDAALERADNGRETMPAASGATHAGRSFVAVGRLEPQKNLPLLLDAFASGGAPEDRLTIIGDGTARGAVERRITQLGLRDRVVLTGYAPDAADRIARHDVLVLSSDYEGLGSVIVEALARQVPVIATECSSTTRHLLAANGFGPSPHGWLVPRRDVAALAEAIARIDPAAFDTASARALARQFTVADSAARYLEVFTRLREDGRLAKGAS